jgi:hypothetical protein
MSYKRVREKKINKVVFATYLQETWKELVPNLVTTYYALVKYLLISYKVIILLRVFTYQELTDGYYLLFKRVFALIHKITG